MPRKCIFLIRTQPQFLFRTHCGFGNRLRGDSEKPRRSTERNIGSCKAQSATTLSMKVKPVKKYGHSCAFARISAKCLVIHSIFTAVVLLTTFVATQLVFASKCRCYLHPLEWSIVILELVSLLHISMSLHLYGKQDVIMHVSR